MENFNFTITLSDGQRKTIDLKTEGLKKHFSEWQNYTGAILEQFNTRDYYQNFLEEDDKVILDLGANIGLFAIHALPWADRIVCVEPTPSHFELLEQLTSEFDTIERVQYAVSPIDAPVIFYTENSNSTMNSLIPRSGEQLVVEGLTLESLAKKCNLDRIDFIKMDIEGSEYIVLNESTVDYILKNVPKILIEFHSNFDEVIPKYKGIFEAHGYTVNHFHWDSIMCIKKK